MNNYLENLKNKPDHIKKRFAFYFSKMMLFTYKFIYIYTYIMRILVTCLSYRLIFEPYDSY